MVEMLMYKALFDMSPNRATLERKVRGAVLLALSLPEFQVH